MARVKLAFMENGFLRRLPFLLSIAVLPACNRQQEAPPPPPPPQVEVAVIRSEPVTLTRELPGRTNAFLVAEVRPQVTGIVEERLFEEGALVEAGQPLYQLDDATYRAQYERDSAALARAESALKLAELNARRVEGLARQNAVSTQEAESAEAELAQAEANVALAKAEVAGSAVLLDYCEIDSPIGGRIGTSAVTQGALVTANQPQALATVQQLDPIYVDLTQSSREWLQLRKDLEAGTLQQNDEMPVRILLEDGTEYAHEGRLSSTEVTVDPTTGSFGLRILVPNPDHILLPGMYVRANLQLGVRREALLVPQRGIMRDATGATSAFLVRDDGRVESRAVLVGQAIGNKWLVEAGLLPGDRVIVEGIQMVQPGMPVEIVESGGTKSGGAVAETEAAESGASETNSSRN